MYVLFVQESSGSIRLNRLHPKQQQQQPPPSPATLCPSTPSALPHPAVLFPSPLPWSRLWTPWTEVEKMKSMGVAGKAIGMRVARQPSLFLSEFHLLSLTLSLLPLDLQCSLFSSLYHRPPPTTDRARLKLHHVAL